MLVTGGPGSGKTTIALLKAKERCAALEAGQGILFLSFSRAAAQQILLRSDELLKAHERAVIHIQTYHSFCIELLHSHGRMLTGNNCRFVFPNDERLQKSAHGEGWDEERERQAREESAYCFDLVAKGASELLRRSVAARNLYAQKFPIIVLDEFQDTDEDQWCLVKELSSGSELVLLADPDQRIFDYRPTVSAERLAHAKAALTPTVFDLGGDNHRSPATDILKFADAVLYNRLPLPQTTDVKQMKYFGKNFDQTVHASVAWIFGELRRRGCKHPTLAVLCRTNALVARVSDVLSQTHTFKTTTLNPITHAVLWDAELSAAAAVVVGSLMDRSGTTDTQVVATLRLVARYYHLKNSESPSKSAAKSASDFERAGDLVEHSQTVRFDAEKQIRLAIVQGRLEMIGDPFQDWRTARELLKAAKALEPLYADANLVRLFGAREALETGLGQRWLRSGVYTSAAELVRSILDRERVISSERAPTGCAVMNMHKAKGKEFDGVVIIEGAYSGSFFADPNDLLPQSGARRLLRVALTRARSLVTVVRPSEAKALVS